MTQNLADAVFSHPYVQAKAATPTGVVPAAEPVLAVQVTYLGDKPRVAEVALAWPLAVDGVEYRTITVKRLTTREVGRFVDQIRTKPEGEKVRWPIFVDAAGAAIPDSVWDALDPDDTDALNEVADRFLPARFRDGNRTDDSVPATGATSAASSATSPTPSPVG